MVKRWVLTDPVLDETYVFPMNPNTADHPLRQRNFSYSTTSSSDGGAIVQEGAWQPAIMEFGGVIYDQAMLDTLTDFSKRRYILQLKDDFEVERYILIRSFTPERKRALHRQNSWKHEYKMQVQVIEVEE